MIRDGIAAVAMLLKRRTQQEIALWWYMILCVSLEKLSKKIHLKLHEYFQNILRNYCFLLLSSNTEIGLLFVNEQRRKFNPFSRSSKCPNIICRSIDSFIVVVQQSIGNSSVVASSSRRIAILARDSHMGTCIAPTVTKPRYKSPVKLNPPSSLLRYNS